MLLIIPAGLYTLQTNLLFVSLSHLDAATYQITYQLKILTTAFFMKLIMKKKISLAQWIALVMLTLGVIFIQLPNSTEENANLTIIGLSALGIACLCSGFSGVYFERILKNSAPSIWMRNIQLGERFIFVYELLM
ncbi:unnamed protein product [Protopolystoma xenopodis]|uniref:Uncharacterized protein n=1 Tax=Protopolystoma xenopodis TaxID=117903 RepID=A0A3S5ALY6_9PLAT|nr:unnamed protein product [Protopolystoma xenopodis]